MPPVFAYWREFSARYVTALCTMPEAQTIPPPSLLELEYLASTAPPMTGAEYLTGAVLESLWTSIEHAFRAELSQSEATIQEFLKQKNSAWNLVGRVHFNLAENRNDDELPFAFLATYTSRLSGHAKAHHVALGAALNEYAGAANKDKLLSLLLPVQRAAADCEWLKRMVDSREIFHPLRWTPAEAFQLLQDLPKLDAAGIIIRMPRSWANARPSRPQVTATVGGKPPSEIGANALLDFRMDITLDGERLTEAEVSELLAASSGLHLVRGRWVEVDREKLAKMFERFRAVQQTAEQDGLSFAEGARMVAGLDESEDVEWGRAIAGSWLAKLLQDLRHPEALARVRPDQDLKATLRPYQEAGLQWLHLLSTLGLGACLADDMGLGKTMQVLALLLVLRRIDGSARRTSVLVAPASLLGNWISEIERFAPDLKTVVAHPSAMSSVELRSIDEKRLADVELVITSYGSLLRVPELAAASMAACHTRRSTGHQESGRKADTYGETAQGTCENRVDRNAGREPNRRSLVHLRFHQSRPSRFAQGVHEICEDSRRAIAESLCAPCASSCVLTFCVA
jgi:non-specific serine/threonine protein kinase